jgi:omega-amidase
MQIACIQSDVILGNSRENFNNMILKIKDAIEKKANIIVLPELWTTGYCLDEINDHTNEQNSIINEIKSIAESGKVSIIAGSFPIINDNGVTNTLVVINEQGDVVKTYDKVHLFQLMNEHHYLQAGDKDGLFNLNGIKAAGFVCYDLRFPEWIQAHSLKGAKVLFFVAEWPIQRMNHWETLLKARAIENQCYVVGCNRVGKDQANTFGGGSVIIDPWGEIISKGGTSEEIIFGKIDLKKVDEIRGRIPIFEDRKEEIYKKFKKSI